MDDYRVRLFFLPTFLCVSRRGAHGNQTQVCFPYSLDGKKGKKPFSAGVQGTVYIRLLQHTISNNSTHSDELNLHPGYFFLFSPRRIFERDIARQKFGVPTPKQYTHARPTIT